MSQLRNLRYFTQLGSRCIKLNRLLTIQTANIPKIPAFNNHLSFIQNYKFCSKNDSEPPSDNKDKEVPPKNRQFLRTVPLKTMKIDNLTEKELSQNPEPFVVFSSNMPIVPFSKLEGVFRTGNLSSDNLEKKLGYFLQNSDGEIYLVGVVLDNDVGKSIQKSMQGKDDEIKISKSSEFRSEITTQQSNYRVKIVEIQINDDGMIAYTIPYKDKKLSEAEKSYNLTYELEKIQQLAGKIKLNVQLEKIEIFEDLEMSKMNFTNYDKKSVDQVLYKIAQGLTKLGHYIRENPNVLIQTLIESRSFVKRTIIVRKKLEEILDILNIVNQNFKNADDQLMKLHVQVKAKGAIEYIKSTYFNDYRVSQDQLDSLKGPSGQQQQGKKQQNLINKFNLDNKSTPKKYKDKLHLIKDPVALEKITKEIERFSQLDSHASEFHKIQTYLDDVFSLPWNKTTPQFWDIQYTEKVLNEKIFGLQRVKDRIKELIAVNQIKKAQDQGKGFVIMLHGPPGTGKTSIAKAIADSLKRPSRFISFAGVSDPYFMKGHRRTYVDSQPGVFVKELIKAQTDNPVFILDEIDKLGRNSHGVDPYYALLEILNPEESSNFTDHYLDIKFDFSKVIFVLTANSVLNMLEPLRNRLEIIEIPAYIEQEKLEIAKNYLIPRVSEKSGITQDKVLMNDDTFYMIMKGWCYYEGGMREMNRCLEKIYRKYILQILQQSQSTKEAQEPEQVVDVESQAVQEENQEVQRNPFENIQKRIVLQTAQSESVMQINQKENQNDVTQSFNQKILQDAEVLDFANSEEPFDLLKKYLGPPIFDSDLEMRTDKVFPPGLVNILSVSDFIGHVLTLECIYDLTKPDKKGILTLSGNLKSVIQESVQIAKLNAYRYLTEEQQQKLNEKNVHLHFLSGSTPKDGPSAGGAICTALISIATQQPVPANLAMTGEISLNGEICKIGGVQGKMIAAKTLGIKTLLIPYANMGEVLDCNKMLLEGITVHFIRDYDQIYNLIFTQDSKKIDEIITLRNGLFVNKRKYESIYLNRSINITNNEIIDNINY